MTAQSDAPRVLIRNPESGDGEATRQARELAHRRGYEVWDTGGGDHARSLAVEAVSEGFSLVAAGGGDGTLNKVIQGVLDATAEDDTGCDDGHADGHRRIPENPTLGVVPVGTGNDFADNVGVRGVEHAFDVLDAGETRRLDLGFADDQPFLNSCVGGLTADASARTSRAMKRRLGVLAYVLSTLQTLRTFDAPRLEIHAEGRSGREVWAGNALMLLVGNGRRFPGEPTRQANMEDGLLNVVVIEDAPAIDYLGRGAVTRLLRRDAEFLTRFEVPNMSVTATDRDVQFSLDGEMIAREALSLSCSSRAMSFKVGESYDPHPAVGSGSPTDSDEVNGDRSEGERGG